MSVIDIAGKLFSEHLNGSVDQNKIISALTTLFSGENGDIDIMGIVSKFQSNGIGSLVSSWMGDGENSPISVDQVIDIFGSEKISEFASNMDLDQGSATEGLSSMIPELINKASSPESMLENIGGADSLVNAAKKFF